MRQYKWRYLADGVIHDVAEFADAPGLYTTRCDVSERVHRLSWNTQATTCIACISTRAVPKLTKKSEPGYPAFVDTSVVFIPTGNPCGEVLVKNGETITFEHSSMVLVK